MTQSIAVASPGSVEAWLKKHRQPVLLALSIAAFSIAGLIFSQSQRKFEPVPRIFAPLRNNDVAAVRNAVEANPAVLAQTDLDGNSPLHIAAILGLTDISRFLIDHHANVDQKNLRGYTPLVLALLGQRPQVGVVKALLDAGADPTVRSPDGDTPLSLATHRQLTEIAVLITRVAARK